MKIYNPTGFSSNLTGSFSGSVKGIFDGSFTSTATTEISGAFDSVSSSLSSRVASQESFSSSLDATFATDADLNLVSSSVDSLNAASSSYALETLISGSFTSISSSIASELLKNTTDTLTGDLTVTGTLTAQDLHVQEVTSSIVYSSGSNIFGSQSSDIQQITGSLYLAEGEVGINATANYFSEKLFVGGLTRTLGLHVAQGIGNSNYGLITHNDDLLEISTDSSRVSGTGHITLLPYGNVGIGTNTPNYLLDIEKSGANVRIYDTTGNTTLNLFSANTANNNIEFGDPEDPNVGQIVYRHASDSFSITTNASEALRIDNSQNVGIGTTTPDNKLHVKDGRIEIESDHPGLGQLWIVSSGSADEASMAFFVNGYGHGGLNPSTDDAWVVGSDGAGASNRFWIYDAGSTIRRFNIDPDGQVGIGTTDPSDPFHLHMANGAIRMDAETDRNHILSRDSNDSTWRDLAISAKSGQKQLILTTGGSVGIGTNSPEFELDVTGSMRTTAFLVVSGSDTQPADIIPFNKPSGSSVNIGTYISSYGFIDISSTHNDGGWIDFSDGSGIDYRGRIRYYNSVDTFKIFTGQSGASTMEISSANKVSIGGASTDGYLEIKQSNNTPSIRLNNGANPSGAYYDLISYTNGYLYLYRNGSTVSVLSDTNGNMGIGTSAPTQPLTVDGGATAVNQGIPATSGTSQNGILRLTSGDATYGETLDFGMNVATTYGWIQATNRDSLAVNYNLALNPNGGNVGIGTSSPDALLQLYTANQKVFELVSTDADGPYAAYKNTSTTLGFIGNAQGITNAGTSNFGIRANSSLVFSSGGANERMRIESGGDIGINTTAADAKVHIRTSSGSDTAGSALSHIKFNVADDNGPGWTFRLGDTASDGSLHIDRQVGANWYNAFTIKRSDGAVELRPADPVSMAGADTNYLGFRVTQTNAQSALLGTIYGQGVSGWGGRLVFRTKPDNGTPNDSTNIAMVIDEEQNVGIGVTPPESKLHVSGESKLQGTNIFGFTGNNYGGNNHSHTFAGYGVPAAGSERYSSYGFLVLNANTNYTGAARKFGITNAFQANKFAILIGSSSLAAPGLTNYGNLETGTTLALTITNSGEVGIGTDSPSVGFHVEQRTLIDSGGSSDIITFQNDNGGFVLGNTTNQASVDLSTGQALRIRQGSNSKIFVNTNGEVILGSDSVTTISTDFIHSIGNVNRGSLASGAYARLVMQERTGDWISFVNGTPVHYGTISVNGSGVSYGSNSDYRLKENILDLSSSIDKVKLLKPKTFNFLDRPDNNVTGFLAHEVQEVIPEAVTGQKDGTIITGDVTEDSTGKVLESNIQEPETLEEGTTFTANKTEPKYQQLDPAKLVPVLTGALKELITKVETLEAEIEALKNA